MNPRVDDGQASPKGLALILVTLSGWNRLAVAFRTVPGSYELGE